MTHRMHPHHPPHDPLSAGLAGVDPLSMDVFKAFKRSMVLNRHLMAMSLSGEESHPGQAGCLLALSHHDGMSPSELATVLHVSRPTVTTMLQRMETAGTIERRTDEHDQRVTRVHLTSRGHALTKRVQAVHADVITSTIGRLTEDDRHELLRLLSLLNEHAVEQLHEMEGGRS